MSFIKPKPNHWSPADFDLSGVDMCDDLSHIAKTVCLLESRCDDYADYLRAIFRDREPKWNIAIDQWNAEECQHGVMLRIMSEAVDSGFRFDACMRKYESTVSYHEASGESVRGSVAAEMVSRCVVEALASALYRVLSDAVVSPRCSDVFSALAQDEARHFGMFLKMLSAEAEADPSLGFWKRTKYAILRMMELEDGQIMVASCIVGGREPREELNCREANHYLEKLYRLYRWKHLKYVVRMLLRTVNLRGSKLLTVPVTAVLFCAVKVRLLWAVVRNRLLPIATPQPQMSASATFSKRLSGTSPN